MTDASMAGLMGRVTGTIGAGSVGEETRVAEPEAHRREQRAPQDTSTLNGQAQKLPGDDR
ncbi:hypothetical protein ACWD0Z_21755 [Streptomyces sp. NPDC003007]